MTRFALSTFAISAIILTTASAGFASVASFQGLGQLPGAFHSTATGVSADGSVVVGSSNGQAFRWTVSGGMVGLGYLPSEYRIWGSTAMATSADGSVVVGVSDSGFGVGDSRQAFRWTADEGIVGLGDPPSGFDFYSSANGISPDGSVIVGRSGTSTTNEAFRWTTDEGMVNLGFLNAGDGYSVANATSANGSVVVGESGGKNFRWTAESGMVHLEPPPVGDLGSYLSGALATSVDGSVIVGKAFSNNADVTVPFRWTTGGGMVGLKEPLRGGFAFATSANGSVVVGQDLYFGAFIWDAKNGMRSLQDILTDDCGLDLTGWSLDSATGISADGLTLVGNGINPNGKGEAFIATITVDIIPEPGALTVIGLGMLVLLRRYT